MSFALTGTRYIGTGPLPIPVLGYDLVATDTGNFYVSNSSATAWVLVGSVNSPNLGMLPLAGGTMTGNVAGATGWAPNDSPNFTTSVKLNGVDLATTTNLSDTSTAILNSIAPKITQAIASTSSSITVKGSIAIAQGLLTPLSVNATIVIPQPLYPDGTSANLSDCKWSIGVYSIPDQGNGLKSIVVTNPGGSNTYTAVCTRDDGVQTNPTMSYLIIGIKS